VHATQRSDRTGSAIELQSGHSPMLTHVRELTDALESLV
jgi:hypothetical protein